MHLARLAGQQASLESPCLCPLSTGTNALPHTWLSVQSVLTKPYPQLQLPCHLESNRGKGKTMTMRAPHRGLLCTRRCSKHHLFLSGSPPVSFCPFYRCERPQTAHSKVRKMFLCCVGSTCNRLCLKYPPPRSFLSTHSCASPSFER